MMMMMMVMMKNIPYNWYPCRWFNPGDNQLHFNPYPANVENMVSA
jgi:hypothetical protein